MKTLLSVCSPLYALILIAGAATSVVGTAAASDANAPAHRTVSFADLNLDHPDGVKALYGRLTAAARAVCQTMPSAPYLLRAEQRKCTNTALTNAVAAIHNPNLTAYFASRTGRGNADEEKLAARR